MRKSEIYALLGLTLDTCIHRFHFPTLDIDIFSPKDYGNLRNQLSKASANDQKLGQQIIQLLLKGKIEEIKTIDETLIFSIQFEHKRELYIAELKLENFKWIFLSIHYAGQAPKTRQVGIWAGLAVVSLSVLLFSALFILDYFQKDQETSSLSTEAINGQPLSNTVPEQDILDSNSSQEEALPLTELEEMAKKMDLVLMNEEEYHNLLSQREQQAEHSMNEEENHLEPTTPSIVITVNYGMSAEQVAKLIVDSDLEVAQNVEELTTFFIEQNIQYKIRTGAHELPLDASYMDIVHILTTRK